PFTDPSGDRLRDWMGVTPDEFYESGQIAIIPMGFCFPGQNAKGGDLPPRRECAPLWRPRLFDALGDVALLLVIGQYAHAYHLGEKRKRTLTDTVAAWQEMYDPGAGQRVMPMPHPSLRNNAWIRKNPWFETDLLPVLRGDIRALLD
ncbi:MAG: uracil-DNA glycosylase family protein, partial [Fimbriimonadaceae bacterium]|nr:uracil-DNA glycosylase family protein [Alphaproteobacteria bacterium]